ncbi:MAG: hypothetical protein NUV50_09890 [Rhodospirillales bacterium]|nr:hypothetical protein [Rhodospirillales bacterium]
MRRLIPITLTAVLLATAPVLAPAVAQDATDPAPDGTASEDTDAQGNFSRNIPEGLKANLTEAEIAAYQARLDAAQTPQERNAIRQELQRTNQERHLAKVQANKQEQPQDKSQKGFFENMRDDFKDVVSGKAAKDAKAAKASDDANKKRLDQDATNGKAGGKSSNKGGNSGGNSGGKNK